MTRHWESAETLGRQADSAAIAALVDEYNDILTAIGGYATLVSAELAPWNPCQRDLDQINVAVRRAADVTKRLVVFSLNGRVDDEHP